MPARPSSPIFDGQPKLSIGDVAVAPSDPNVVWVGTGEAYCARSSSSGDGIWKSVDAGKTWTNMGLADSHHIARIVIHPKNPDIVYVAAMGHLFSPNAERGVFKTTDGGKSWKKVLYRQRQDRRRRSGHGRIDPGRPLRGHVRQGPPALALRARRPGERDLQDDRRRRRPGPASAAACRPGRIGRIGLDVYQKNPDILYAVVENGNRRAADGPGGRDGQAPRRRRRRRGPSATRSSAPTTAAGPGARSTPATRRPSTRPPTRSTSSASTRTIPRPSTSPGSPWPRPTTAARPGRASTGRPTGSCPAPSATGG